MIVDETKVQSVRQGLNRQELQTIFVGQHLGLCFSDDVLGDILSQILGNSL